MNDRERLRALVDEFPEAEVHTEYSFSQGTLTRNPNAR